MAANECRPAPARSPTSPAPAVGAETSSGRASITTVGFEVAAAADGTPDIINITTSDATAEIGDVDHAVGDEAARAKVSIVFTNGIEQRSLSIRVTAASSDDSSSAKVSVSLSDVRGQRLPAEQVVGAHTWDGMLCDGTVASISLHSRRRGHDQWRHGDSVDGRRRCR